MTNQPSLYRIPYANLGRLAGCRALSGQDAQASHSISSTGSSCSSLKVVVFRLAAGLGVVVDPDHLAPIRQLS
jgi:hypothetical protein